MRLHWAGTETASTVPTTAFELVQLRLPAVVDDGLVAAVTGGTGCGKTFAARSYAETLTSLGIPWTWLHLTADVKDSRRALPLRMLSTLNGTRMRDLDGEQHLLIDDLLELLTDSGRVVFIDEAHRMGVHGLQRVRDVWRIGNFSWSLIEIGSGLPALLGNELLADAVSVYDVHIPFDPLAGPDLLAALRAYHPLLAEPCPATLLRRVNDQWAHGRWRQWAQFLRQALILQPQLAAAGHPTVTLTDTLADLTLAAMPRIPIDKASVR